MGCHSGAVADNGDVESGAGGENDADGSDPVGGDTGAESNADGDADAAEKLSEIDVER